MFGNALERARDAFAGRFAKARRILLVGEGNGRFLKRALRLVAPSTELVILDASRRMLEAARRRCGAPLNPPQAAPSYVQGDARTWFPGGRTFDLVVTHFVLDLYTGPDQERLIANLDRQTTNDAHWIDVDFVPDPNQRAHQILMWCQYRFFRFAAGLETDRLHPTDPVFRNCGWKWVSGEMHAGALVQARLWRKSHAAAASARASD